MIFDDLEKEEEVLEKENTFTSEINEEKKTETTENETEKVTIDQSEKQEKIELTEKEKEILQILSAKHQMFFLKVSLKLKLNCRGNLKKLRRNIARAISLYE